MTDYYLRAESAEAMNAYLETLPAESVTVDVLGAQYEQVGEDEYEPLSGFYANVRTGLELDSTLEGIEQVYPKTPWRVFAD